MDGLRGVWHGGPFAHNDRFVFYPRRIFFGTDPVAIDRLLLDIVDQKRKAEGAISIWDRSPASLRTDDMAARDSDPECQHPDPRARARGIRVAARARRVRHDADHGAAAPGMTGLVALLCGGSVADRAAARSSRASFWARPVADSLAMIREAGIERLCVPPELAPSWRDAGMDAVEISRCGSRLAQGAAGAWHRAPSRPRVCHAQPLAGGERLAVPACARRTVQVRPATRARAPWPRRRPLRMAGCHPLGRRSGPPGGWRHAGLSATTFRRRAAQAPLADLGVVDDGSEEMGEVMNLLSRRNLLFELVKARDRRFPVTVALGSKAIPA